MRDISKSIYELLSELDELFRENEIEYCLEGNIVRDAYLRGSMNSGVYEANISMDTKNMRKLYSVIETFKREDRLFECPTNTKRKRDFVIRYLNTKTFFLDLKRPGRSINKCIRVNIYLRVNRYDNPLANKAKKLQIAWRSGTNNMVVLRNNFLRCSLMKFKRIIFGELSVGKKAVKKWLAYNEKQIDYSNFNKFHESKGISQNDLLDLMRNILVEKKEQSEAFKNSQLTNFEEYLEIRRELPVLTVNGTSIPAFMYDNLSYVNINDKKFPIPSPTELYLWFALGIKNAFNAAGEGENDNVIASELLSYDDMLKKYKPYFDKHKKKDRFLKKERIIRGIIRRPIRKMFDEFERIFFTERGYDTEGDASDL